MDIADGSGMVGRAAELARLDELLAGLADGRGGLAWVQGEPGVGKSTLIDATLARFSQRGAIFRAAGEPLMRPFPLRLMADCLGVSATAPDAAARQIAGLLRGEPGGYAALDPVLAAAEKMLELVDRLCARDPVILVAEDLQWADEPSLLVWSRLARAVDQIPLLLIGAARPLPQRAQLDQIRALVAERAGVVIDLAPLAAGDAAALAALIAGGEPGPRLRSALGRAGGNPLYLRELVDALVRDGLVAIGRDGASAGSPSAQPPTAELLGDVTATPASLRVAIGSRLGFMSAPTLQAVQMAALLGHEFDLGELAAATGQRVSRLAEVLADAIAGGVLSGSGEELRFRHGLIHQILLDQTPEALRRPLHAEIARLLAAAGRPVDSVARHLLAVPGSMEPWAVEWLATTAEPMLLALSEVSADLLERAIEAGGEDGEHGAALGSRLAEVLFWLGRDEAAAEAAAGVAARTGDEIRAARLRIIVMRAAGRLGRAQDGLAVALRSPGDDGLPPMWRARIGAWSAQLWLLAGDRERAGHGAAAALDQATASGDALSIAFARYACALCGPAAEGPAQIAAALAILPGTEPESVDLRILLLVSQLVQGAYHGRLDGSQAAIAEVLALADQAGGFRAAAIRATAAGFCYRYGLWDEALVQEAGIDPEHLSSATLSPQHGLVATIALRRGDTGLADAHLRAGVGRLPQTTADPPVPVSPLTEALARRAEADGDLPRAVSIMSAWLSAAPGIGRYDRHDDLPYLVRLALSAGDATTARAATATAEADVVADASPSRIAAAAFCRALLAGDADALLALAGQYRGYGWIPHMAAALEEAAVCLAGAGQAAAARAALTDAVRTYADLGATWDIRRADARLRAHGIRRGPRSAHRRATTGWAALTPSEANIARMVADGLSNPDIAAELYLSRRTVQTHVSNILTKLQARSRIDIIRTAQRQPPAPPTSRPPRAEPPQHPQPA